MRIREVFHLFVFGVLLTGCSTLGTPIKSNVDLEKWSTTISAEIKKPKGKGPYPTILLLHGCSGLGPKSLAALREQAEFFVQHGFQTAIVDSFGPRFLEGGQACGPPLGGRALYFRRWDAVNVREYMISKQNADPSNIFLLGLSQGGSVALMLAQRDWLRETESTVPFRGAVGYYPGCRSALFDDLALLSPILIFIGDADDWTLALHCVSADKENPDKDIEVVVYPGVTHSFILDINTEFLGHTLSGDREATEKSKAKSLAFFRSLMKAKK